VEPYGVFCLEVRELLSDGRVLVRSMPELGKRDIPQAMDTVEKDLLYPAVRGADIERWGATPKIHVLMPQDPQKAKPYPEAIMKQRWPHTYGYLTRFKDILLSRGSKMVRQFAERTEFYAMFGIGPYTVAPYKVVWKRMASDLVAAVVSQVKTPYGFKTVIPTDTTSLFATDDEAEAHFLCAVINSTTVREFIKSYSAAGRGFGAPSVMEHVAIPKFDKRNKLHVSIGDLSLRLHEIKQKQQQFQAMAAQERELDGLVKKLFGIP
jgi:hypothetical protein